MDTFRCSGPGGQHINKTDSGVRITHIESGLVAECRETRSQHQNKSIAFRKLSDLVVKWVLDKQKVHYDPVHDTIRTYHNVDNRVKDHESGFQQSYSEVEKDIGPMIRARKQSKIE